MVVNANAVPLIASIQVNAISQEPKRKGVVSMIAKMGHVAMMVIGTSKNAGYVTTARGILDGIAKKASASQNSQQSQYQ